MPGGDHLGQGGTQARGRRYGTMHVQNTVAQTVSTIILCIDIGLSSLDQFLTVVYRR